MVSVPLALLCLQPTDCRKPSLPETRQPRNAQPRGGREQEDPHGVRTLGPALSAAH